MPPPDPTPATKRRPVTSSFPGPEHRASFPGPEHRASTDPSTDPTTDPTSDPTSDAPTDGRPDGRPDGRSNGGALHPGAGRTLLQRRLA